MNAAKRQKRRFLMNTAFRSTAIIAIISIISDRIIIGGNSAFGRVHEYGGCIGFA